MFQVFHDFGGLRTSFWLPYWLYFESSVWAFGKTAESVVRVVNFGGLALARLILFTCSDRGIYIYIYICVYIHFVSNILFIRAAHHQKPH
jgi:hypothetical protein